MKWNDDNAYVAMLLSVALLVLVIVATRDLVSNAWREEAIQHNAAEWRIDRTTGDKEFVWLTDE